MIIELNFFVHDGVTPTVIRENHQNTKYRAEFLSMPVALMPTRTVLRHSTFFPVWPKVSSLIIETGTNLRYYILLGRWRISRRQSQLGG